MNVKDKKNVIFIIIEYIFKGSFKSKIMGYEDNSDAVGLEHSTTAGNAVNIEKNPIKRTVHPHVFFPSYNIAKTVLREIEQLSGCSDN